MGSTFTVLVALQTLMETNYRRSFRNRHSSHGDSTNQNIGELWQQKYCPLVLLVKRRFFAVLMSRHYIQIIPHEINLEKYVSITSYFNLRLPLT